MDTLFKDLLEISDVRGVVWRSPEGIIRHQFLRHGRAPNLDQMQPMLDALETIQEADLIFTDSRLYLRRSEAGHLIVVMNRQVPIAMVRLHCDMIIPRLTNPPKQPSHKFWKFLKS